MHIYVQDANPVLIQVIVRFLRMHDNCVRTFAGLFPLACAGTRSFYSPVVAEPLLRKATAVRDRASRLLHLNAHVAITANAVTGSDFTLRSIDFADLDFRFGFPLRAPSTDRRIDMLSAETTRSQTINWPILLVRQRRSAEAAIIVTRTKNNGECCCSIDQLID